MKYVIHNRAKNSIVRFYQNVAKKYKHTYSKELMHKNINNAFNSIYQIENGLLRRKPLLARWQGCYMATSKDKRWNFAYKIKDNTIYVYDACHSQNIHDNKKIIDTIVTEVINDIKRQLLALTK